MKVKELVALLKQADQESEVKLSAEYEDDLEKDKVVFDKGVVLFDLKEFFEDCEEFYEMQAAL